MKAAAALADKGSFCLNCLSAKAHIEPRSRRLKTGPAVGRTEPLTDVQELPLSSSKDFRPLGLVSEAVERIFPVESGATNCGGFARDVRGEGAVWTLDLWSEATICVAFRGPQSVWSLDRAGTGTMDLC